MNITDFKIQCEIERKLFNNMLEAWQRIQNSQWKYGKKYVPIKQYDLIYCPNCNSICIIYRILDTEYFIYECNECKYTFAESIMEKDIKFASDQYILLNNTSSEIISTNLRINNPREMHTIFTNSEPLRHVTFDDEEEEIPIHE